MSVRIPRQIVEQIQSHAAASDPEECCGLLVGRHEGEAVLVTAAPRTVNAAAADQRRDRFTIEPLDYLKADRAARAAGLEIVGVYHSHPVGPAEPSPTDLQRAWPNMVYLIASLVDGQVDAMTCWALDPSTVPAGFRAVRLTVR